MTRLLQEGKREKKRPTGAFRRKVEKVMGPMRACFQTRWMAKAMWALWLLT